MFSWVLTGSLVLIGSLALIGSWVLIGSGVLIGSWVLLGSGVLSGSWVPLFQYAQIKVTTQYRKMIFITPSNIKHFMGR